MVRVELEQIALIEFKVPFKKPFLTSRNRNVAGYGILVVIEGVGPKGRVAGVGECSPRKLVTGETVAGAWPFARGYRDLLLQKHAEWLIDLDVPCMIEQVMTALKQDVEGEKPVQRFPSVSLGFEIALLDITAQALGIPVYKLLGDKGGRPEANTFTFSARYDASDDDVARMARHAKRYAYARCKGSGKADRDLYLLRRLMRHLEENRSDTHLWMDLNEKCDTNIYAFVDQLYDDLEACSQERIVVLEQPLPRGKREALGDLARYCRDRSVNRQTAIRIMADEAFDGEQDLRDNPGLLEMDALNIKPQKAGSIIACRRIADYVHARKKSIGTYVGGVIGSTDITSWATYHLSRALPNLQYSTLSPKTNFKFPIASVRLRKQLEGDLCPPIFSGLGTGLNPHSLGRGVIRMYPEGALSSDSKVFAIRSPRQRYPYAVRLIKYAIALMVRLRNAIDKIYRNPRIILRWMRHATTRLSRLLRPRRSRKGMLPEMAAHRVEGGMPSTIWRSETIDLILGLGEANRFREPWLQHLSKKHLDSYLIEREALARGYSVTRYSALLFVATDSSSRVELGFYWTAGAAPSMATRHLTSKKHLTKARIKASGAPVPEGQEFSLNDKEKARSYARSLAGKPFVVKPAVGTGGVGVSTGLLTLEDFDWAWEKIIRSQKATMRNDGFIIVEEQVPGDDYRVCVVGEKAVSIVKRAPAHIVGDGRHAVEHLVNLKNQSRAANPHLAQRRIRLDRSAVFQLARQGMRKGDVPPAGQVVFLSTAGNISQGGDSISVLHETHASILEAAVKAVRAFPGLAVGGVDFLMEDHRIDLSNQRAGICEINSVPASTMHHYPAYGESCNVSRLIFEEYARLRSLPLGAPNERCEQVQVRITTMAEEQRVKRWIEPLIAEYAVEWASWRKESHDISFQLSGPYEPITALASRFITGTEGVAVESVGVQVVN